MESARRIRLLKKIGWVTAIFITLLSGCSGKNETTKTDKVSYEYAEENKVSLPNEVWLTYDLRETVDHGYLLVGQSKDRKGFLWTSQDTVSWEKAAELPEELQNSAIVEAKFMDDQQVFCVVDYNAYDTNRVDMEIRYYVASKGGEFTQRNLDIVNDSISDIQIKGTNVYGRNENGQIAAYDYNTGKKAITFDKSGMFVNSFCIMKEGILAIGPSEAEMYDINTGNLIEMDAPLREKIVEVSDKNDLQFIPRLAFDSESEMLYYVTLQGMYEYDVEMKEFKTLLYGKAHAFGNVERKVTSLAVASYGTVYMSVLTGDMQSEMYCYTPSPEGIKLNQEAPELKVYSLKKDATIQAIISNYNATQNDVHLEYVYGISGTDATTEQDAINKLNVELLAGEGPDILMLDKLPSGALVEKKILADISDITDDKKLFSNIAVPYQKDKKTYGMPLYFKLMGIHGDKEVVKSVGSLEELTASLVDEKAKHPDSLVIDKYDEHNYMDVLYSAYQQDLFNGNELSSEKVKVFYEQLEKINTLAWYNHTVKVDNPEEAKICDFSYLDMDSNGLTEYLLETNDLRVSISGVTGARDLSRLYSFGKGNDFEYTFLKRDGQILFMPNMVLGINAGGKHIAEAKTFIESCLTEDAYKNHYSEMTGFPVNRDVLEGYFKEAGVKEEVSNSKNELISVELKAVSKKQKEEFFKLVEGLKQTADSDITVKSIVMKQAELYVNGKETIDQCAEAAVEKVNLYLKE